MVAFITLLKANINRRIKDGFAVGYNIIFPLLLIWLLGFVCKRSFQENLVTGYQYYGMVLIPFCIFLSIITAAYAGKDDAYANTADRVLIAPVSVRAIGLSKIISETIVFMLCSVLVLFIASIVWDVCTLTQVIQISLLYGACSFFIAAFGTYIGLGMKDFLKIKNIINIPVGIFGLLGGCFFRFGTLNKTVSIVLKLSPLTWINRSIIGFLYDNNRNLIYLISAVLLLLGLVFTQIAIVCFKKEEYGYGMLPSYDK